MRLLKVLPLLVFAAGHLAGQAPSPPAPSLLGFGLSGSATFGSQYLFRGLTQTDGKPTLQGELDLAHPAGWYLSLAMSNISWFTDQNAGMAGAPVALGSPAQVGPPYQAGKVNSAGVEVDLSGGYKWAFAKDWVLDAGMIRYLYPGTYDNLGVFRNPDTTEAYLGLAYAWAGLKISRVVSADCFGMFNSEGATYLDLSLAVPMGESGWTLLLHGGRTTYPGKANPDFFFDGARIVGDNALFSYTDAKVGLAREFKGYTLTLAGTHADTKAAAPGGQVPVYGNAMGHNLGGNRAVMTLSKAF